MKNGKDSIKIEKGIPIPLHGNSGVYRATLDKMEVGDSVLLPLSGAMASNYGK